MIYEPRKSLEPNSARPVTQPFLKSFYQRLFPKMRFGNQPDMPTITTDRLWFLRENRFLFLTRDGPIEVTLKPSLVLTGILVCMAGIAAIFYYTLIASYSAIEVMRDETIKTAEASSNSAERDLGVKSKILTWKEYEPLISQKQRSFEMGRERPSTSKTVNNQIENKSNISNPRITKRGGIADRDAEEQLPLIIQGGRRITLANKKRDENSGSALDVPPFIDSDKSQIKNSVSTDNQKTAKNMLANTDLSAALTSPKHAREINSSTTPKITPLSETKTPSENLTASATKNSHGQIETNKLANRAQEFALALIPSFIAKPKSINPDIDAKETENLEKTKKIQQHADSARVASIVPDDGFSSNKDDLKGGITLPVMTEAVRIKKMLLAYRGEIDYIRSTVTGLGILQDKLPAPLSLQKQGIEQLTDKDFRSLMIKLAEYRAALRKIPLKPPMLYYYISSGYGMRKHPKTGKKTFHHGIDLAGTWQENVRATAPGKIIYAGSEGAFGKVVRVQHEFGVVTTYAHLARITVRLGDYVSENHVIGKMGNTGRSVGAHLHYEIRVNGKSINPNNFMKVGRQLSVAGELQKSAFID